MPDRPDCAPLPNALSTGITMIDEEHRQLRAFIDRLRTICDDFDSKQSCVGCASDKVRGCESALLDCVTDLLGYMVAHFRTEENLMKDLGISVKHHERYLMHAEDHANIADRVALLARPQDRQQTVRAITDTAVVLSRWLDHHIMNHDVPMLH